ncbi:hypothetical protein [Marinicrinis lubricantis]|uniref:Uncharacterized protein n=1 Tax=Marinicrinis lubricantis TaxID=2086470 RepID=A0ABW1IV56_9BACL
MFVFVVSSSIVAESINEGGDYLTVSEEQLNLYLEQADYPMELIQLFETDQKRLIYKSRAQYHSHTVTNATLVEKNNDLIMTMGAWDNFTHAITLSEISSPRGSVSF